MRVLITGGAGFIGHNLALYLSNLGYDVKCLDNLSRSSKEAIEVLKNWGIELAIADVTDYDGVMKVLNELRPEVVVHAAALISVGESFDIPEEYFRCNVVGTLTTIRSCCRVGVVRFIYLSSAAVYGDPIKLPISEEHPVSPKSPYGLSKFMGEEVVRFYSKLYGIEYLILRLFNVYGPRQSLSEYSGVITKFVERVRRGLPPIIYGDGRQSRDFIHVLDVCRAIELCIKSKVFNEVYNVGSGRPVSINELANLVLRLSGLDLSPIYEGARVGDIRYSYADITKIRKDLGFQPLISLEEGIKELLTKY